MAAKRHYVAYSSDRATRTEKIKLWTLFEQRSLFTSIQHPIHDRSIRYTHRTLFWKSAGAWLRFVWIIDQGRCWLLMGSDLNLEPIEMIRLYTRRSKIEVLFWTLTQVIGAFGYRFWSKALPKLNKNKAHSGTQPIPTATWESLLPTLKAIESFVNIASIATGILQYLALTHTRQIWLAHQATAWLRSYSSSIPSEQVVQRVIQARVFVGRQDKALAWLRQAIHQANQPQRLNPPKVPNHPTLSLPDPPNKPS